VVYAEDLSLLIEGETSSATNGNRVEWLWNYEKQRMETPTESGDFDLLFTIGFDRLKLCELRFGEHFLGLMPKPLILGLLRSVGQAEVNIRKGTVAMKWVGPGPNQKVELPTRTQVTNLLGAPFLVTRTNGTQTYLYKYYQKADGQSALCERLAWAKFTFKGESDEIAGSDGMIGNVAWRMVRVAGQPEPQVTFWLEGLSVEPVAIALPEEICRDYVGQYKEAGGTVLNVGRDGGAFVLSWTKEKTGGWCAALPEQTNMLFGVPSGLPRGTFFRDSSGTVTGVVAQLQGTGTAFSKFSPHLPELGVPVRVNPAAYETCAGRYKASWGGTVIITRQGEQLFWQNEGVDARIPIYPSSETNFFFKAVDSPLTFVKNEQGQVTKFVLRFNGRTSDAVKATGDKQGPTGRS
jgi:hypothetical protein